MAPSLVIKAGPLAGRRFELGPELVVGRVDADVTIEDPLLSRRHALIRSARGEVQIEDLGSRNGTWVNGERITGVMRIEPGDVIEVGDTSLEVEFARERDGRTVLAPREDAGRGKDDEELRLISALFADLGGSAAAGESLRTVTGAVERFGGAVQAAPEGRVVALFGLPDERDDDAERAARAALAIRDTVAAPRIGIATGEIDVELLDRGDPRWWARSDATNVAAGLESLADPGTILVEQATARRLVHEFEFEPLGDANVAGRGEPVEAWKLICAQPDEVAESAAPAPVAAPPLSLRFEVDWKTGEVLLDLGEESEQIRLVYDGGRWRIAPLAGAPPRPSS